MFVSPDGVLTVSGKDLKGDAEEEITIQSDQRKLLVNEILKFMKFFVEDEDFDTHFKCLKNEELVKQLKKNYLKFLTFIDISELMLDYFPPREVNYYREQIKKLNEGYDYWKFYKGLKENPAGGEPLNTSNSPRPSDYRFGVDRALI